MCLFPTPYVQTITVGDVKDDVTKGKKRKHDKWKKKNGGKANKHAAHGDVAEIDTRLLSALLTVRSPSLLLAGNTNV